MYCSLYVISSGIIINFPRLESKRLVPMELWREKFCFLREVDISLVIYIVSHLVECVMVYLVAIPP